MLLFDQFVKYKISLGRLEADSYFLQEVFILNVNSLSTKYSVTKIECFGILNILFTPTLLLLIFNYHRKTTNNKR